MVTVYAIPIEEFNSNFNRQQRSHSEYRPSSGLEVSTYCSIYGNTYFLEFQKLIWNNWMVHAEWSVSCTTILGLFSFWCVCFSRQFVLYDCDCDWLKISQEEFNKSEKEEEKKSTHKRTIQSKNHSYNWNEPNWSVIQSAKCMQIENEL